MNIGTIVFNPDSPNASEFTLRTEGGIISGFGLPRDPDSDEQIEREKLATCSLTADLRRIQEKQTLADSIVTKYAGFMDISQAHAGKSKNRGTKVGCVILGPEFEIRSSGWNGAPRGCAADTDSRFDEKTERLYWTSHSEANAIAQAARVGTPLALCTIVVTHAPCMACAKLIVQAGIIRVINPKPNPDYGAKWAEDIQRTRALFRECRVQHVEIDTIGE